MRARLITLCSPGRCWKLLSSLNFKRFWVSPAPAMSFRIHKSVRLHKKNLLIHPWSLPEGCWFLVPSSSKLPPAPGRIRTVYWIAGGIPGYDGTPAFSSHSVGLIIIFAVQCPPSSPDSFVVHLILSIWDLWGLLSVICNFFISDWAHHCAPNQPSELSCRAN